jgi:hypothetical protein
MPDRIGVILFRNPPFAQCRTNSLSPIPNNIPFIDNLCLNITILGLRRSKLPKDGRASWTGGINGNPDEAERGDLLEKIEISMGQTAERNDEPAGWKGITFLLVSMARFPFPNRKSSFSTN